MEFQHPPRVEMMAEVVVSTFDVLFLVETKASVRVDSFDEIEEMLI